MKYIVVTGGVVSGLGKGITISSIGRLLKLSGVRVTAIKIDPYLNVDAGTMSPFEHGETFVLDDGGETDLDLGNYERFLDVTLTKQHNITSGKVYQEVLMRERRGDYLGKTVQIVPHSTDLVQDWIREVAKTPVDGSGFEPDVCLIEVGGTVGDIESMVFLEALRQFQFREGRDNILFIHVSLVPVLGSVGEQKTKPTQHSVKELRAIGLSPDLVVCRSSSLLSDSTKSKLSTFCDVLPNHVFSVCDVSNIYHVPLILAQQNIHSIIKSHFSLSIMTSTPELNNWRTMAVGIDKTTEEVSIGIVGKYNGLSDAYLSVMKALTHSCIFLGLTLKISWVDASELEDGTAHKNPEKHKAAWDVLKGVDGILVPGGFGSRGVEGKILATQWARENKKPFLGVCLGMQAIVIDYARNVLQMRDANSTEFDDTTPHPVVIFMPEINHAMMGGTMRLGARGTVITPVMSIESSLERESSEKENEKRETEEISLRNKEEKVDKSSNTDVIEIEMDTKTEKSLRAVDGGRENENEIENEIDKEKEKEMNRFTVTLAAEVYGLNVTTQPGDDVIVERHRHRYEVNPDVVARLESGGLVFSGKDEKGVRMEITELSREVHPYFLGVQFHPEFKSRPDRPSPPFFGLVAAACGRYSSLHEAGVKWQAYESSLYSPHTPMSPRSPSSHSSFSNKPTVGGVGRIRSPSIIRKRELDFSLGAYGSRLSKKNRTASGSDIL